LIFHTPRLYCIRQKKYPPSPRPSPGKGKGLYPLTSTLAINGRESFPLTLTLFLAGEREIKESGFHRERKIKVMGLLRAVFR
jgi:hypothetical protein